MEPIIEIKNLTKTFGSGENQVEALRDVNISVNPGEIFGIIGLSGAGKSTLVRCINLLERPTEGKVLIDDIPKKVFSHVSLLKQVGLDVPQATEIVYELRKCGIDLPDDIITDEECVEALSKLLGEVTA